MTATELCSSAELLDQSSPEAERLYSSALRLDRQSPHAWNGLGRVLITRAAKHPVNSPALRQANAQATAHFTRALHLCPSNLTGDSTRAVILANRATAFFNCGEWQRCWEDSSHSLGLVPSSRAAYLHARALWCLEEYERGITACDSALIRYPDHGPLVMMAAFNRFILGDWSDGWRLWARRPSRQSLRVRAQGLNTPEWEAKGDQPLTGKRVLVFGEDGIGDQIMFGRWLPLLLDRGCEVAYVADSNTLPLFTRLTRQDPAAARDVMYVDYWVGMQDLPRLLNAPIPACVPPMDLRHYRHSQPGTQLRVGVCWHGAASTPVEWQRPSNLTLWLTLASTPRVTFQSLQYGEQGLPSFQPLKVSDMEDTARVIGSLDLVITADTVIAHLAASIGVPTWMLYYRPGEWRWGLPSDGNHDQSSPWYPDSMRIFRQERAGKWGPVFKEVERELDTLVHSR